MTLPFDDSQASIKEGTDAVEIPTIPHMPDMSLFDRRKKTKEKLQRKEK